MRAQALTIRTIKKNRAWRKILSYPFNARKNRVLFYRINLILYETVMTTNLFPLSQAVAPNFFSGKNRWRILDP